MILTTNIATLLITIGVGIVLPWLVALVTKESMPPQVKAAILLLLSIVAGIIGGLVTTPPVNWAQWEQVLLTIFVTFVAAFSSEYMGDRTNLTPGINHATGKFGIRAPEPKPAEAPAP